MTSRRRETPVLLGDQRPRVSWIPPYVSSAGAEAIELAALAGLVLDPWQQFILAEALGERSDGKWAAFEVGVVVPRQNGKGGFLEARELAGLFLLDELLLIHSAHQFDTSLEAFGRLLTLIEETPELDRRVQRVSRSHGEEGITLRCPKGLQRIRFRTRTAGGGRGFSCDCLILDEAMILPRKMHGALMPTMAARMKKTPSGPQIWYTGSAVDEEVHEHGVVFAKVRERGMAGGDPELMFCEHSVDPAVYEADPVKVATDPKAWAQANPGLGIRIDPRLVAAEQRSMDARTFATERLGIGHWPVTSEDSARVIPLEKWKACADQDSRISGAKVFAVDVTPDRGKASIAVAGPREDGLSHVEIVANAAGTGWLVDRCVALKAKHEGCRFVVDPRSPAGSLIADLVDAGVTPDEVDTQDYARACGTFYDLAVETKLRYRAPQPELDLAVGAASRRSLGDSWAWARRSPADISPLVAATLAVWGAQTVSGPPQVWDLNDVVAKLRAKRAAAKTETAPSASKPEGQSAADRARMGIPADAPVTQFPGGVQFIQITGGRR